MPHPSQWQPRKSAMWNAVSIAQDATGNGTIVDDIQAAKINGTRTSEEALDQVIQEYFAMLSGLSSLTEDLPNRLRIGSKRRCVPSSNIDPISSNNQGSDQLQISQYKPHLDAVSVQAPKNGDFHELEPSSPWSASQRATVRRDRPSSDEAIDNMGSLTVGTGSNEELERSPSSAELRRANSRSLSFTEKKLRSMLQSDDAANEKETGILPRLLKACHCSNLVINEDTFDFIVGIFIILNCFTIIVNLEYKGYQSEISLGSKVDDGSWSDADDWFRVIEHSFNIIFILELVLRIVLFGRHVLYDKAVILDIFLVITSSFQLYVLTPIEKGGGLNLSYLRLLRFIKFVRIFRLVRVLALFSHLRVLVKAVISSFQALVWSMLLLTVIMVMIGMLLSETLHEFITDPEQDITHRKWAFRYYGTSTRAIYTLFEITLSGCWPQYVRPLIDNVSIWYIIFVLFYIMAVVFAIIRIISAIFLKETLAIANSDEEMLIQEKVEQNKVYKQKLERVFMACDTTHSGNFSQDEFERIMSNSFVKAWLNGLDLEVHDVHALFTLLEDGNGYVSHDDFLKGIMRLKGQARTMDIVSILHANEKLQKAVDCIQTVLVSQMRTKDMSSVLESNENLQKAVAGIHNEMNLMHELFSSLRKSDDNIQALSAI